MPLPDGIYTNLDELPMTMFFLGAASPGSTFSILLTDENATFSRPDLTLAAVAANEVSGSGYSRQNLSNLTVTRDDASHFVKVTADNIIYSSLDVGTVGALVIFIDNHASDDTLNIPLIFTGSLFDPLVTDGDPVVLRLTDGIFLKATDATLL